MNKLLKDCLEMTADYGGDCCEWDIDYIEDYAMSAGFPTWGALIDDFFDEVHFLGLDGLIEVDDNEDGSATIFNYGALMETYEEVRKKMRSLIIEFFYEEGSED